MYFRCRHSIADLAFLFGFSLSETCIRYETLRLFKPMVIDGIIYNEPSDRALVEKSKISRPFIKYILPRGFRLTGWADVYITGDKLRVNLIVLVNRISQHGRHAASRCFSSSRSTYEVKKKKETGRKHHPRDSE